MKTLTKNLTIILALSGIFSTANAALPDPGMEIV